MHISRQAVLTGLLSLNVAACTVPQGPDGTIDSISNETFDDDFYMRTASDAAGHGKLFKVHIVDSEYPVQWFLANGIYCTELSSICPTITLSVKGTSDENPTRDYIGSACSMTNFYEPNFYRTSKPLRVQVDEVSNVPKWVDMHKLK